MPECQYANIAHKCDGAPAVRVWSDVNQSWVYGCRVIASQVGTQSYITEAVPA